MIKKSHTPIVNDTKNNYYKDIASTENDMSNKCLTFANQNGIQLYADGKLNANASVTLREIAAMLVQFDSVIGTQSATTTDADSKTGSAIIYDQKIQYNIQSYPTNKDKFQLILADVPSELYTTPFSVKDNRSKYGNPIIIYNFAREYKDIFCGMLYTYKGSLLNNSKAVVKFTYFPSLVCENGNGFTMRVKCEVISIPNELLIKDVFKVSKNVSEDQKIYTGMVFYGDIASGQTISSIQLTSELATLDKIIYIVK